MEWVAVFLVIVTFACLVALLKRVEKLEEGMKEKLGEVQVKVMIAGKADKQYVHRENIFGYIVPFEDPTISQSQLDSFAHALGYERYEKPEESGWRKAKKVKS